MLEAWKDFLPSGSVEFVVGDLAETLAPVLQAHSPAFVVACHACAHLSDQTIDITIQHNLSFATMR